MLERRVFMFAGAAAMLAACDQTPGKSDAPQAQTQPVAAPDPSAAVRPLYDRYLVQGGAFPSFKDAAPWSGDLWSKLEAMTQRSEAANEPILDFDPIIGAQDYQLSNVTATTDSLAANSHAVVRAHFVNLGSESEIVYDMVWENGAWRVDNIRGNADGQAWDLRQIAGQTTG